MLTGEKLELTIPDFEDDMEPRSENRQLEGKEVYSAPNPIVNDEHFVYFEHAESPMTHNIQVYDLNGHILLNKEDFAGNNYRIDCKEWPDGLYWLKVTDMEGIEIYQTKIILIH